MAFNTIKGLTVEIGGDTTKLGKALEDVNKKGRDVSSELNEINRLLKLDPGNTELLAQKQKVLAAAIANSAEKLDTLKKAEKQVQEQFKRGEVSEEQVRSLQREIVKAEKELEKFEKEANEAANSLDKLDESADDAEESSESLGDKLSHAAKVGLAAVGAAAAAAVAALTAAAEATREYRTEMGKLDTAFTTAGHSTEAATNTYKVLQGVLGETDQAVEAANHLAKLTKSEQDLQKWTDICTGVYATFGASLPIEGLTEAANETAKVGQVTGPLADALNWAGVNEDAFNESLAACNNEQERQALIMETLNGLYTDAASKYKETNAEVIRANQANEEWMATMAEVGGVVEPILTDVKLLGASLLSDLVPGIKEAAGAFRDLLNGDEGAAASIGEAFSNILTQLLEKTQELLPTITSMGISLVTSLVESIVAQAPSLVETGIQAMLSVLDGLTKAIPKVVDAVVEMIPQLVQALADGAPDLVDGALAMFMAIIDAIDLLLPPLIKAIPTIVMSIVDALLDAIPTLIDGALQLLLAIVDAIPLLIKELVPLIPSIVVAICNGLLKAAPQLLKAAVSLFGGLVKAIPQTSEALRKSLPQIWNTIFGYLKQLPSKVVSIGKDLVSGLWKGISDKATWLKNKIKSWVGDVTKFLKKLFGINSPSKVTAYMGEMLDEGLAVGIEDNAKKPMAALGDLSEDMLDEAGQLNGLTLERRLTHTFNPGTPAEGATSMLGKLDQILKAIERGQILTIDGNALVGATANSMNNALGQRRILAERGAV